MTKKKQFELPPHSLRLELGDSLRLEALSLHSLN